MTEDVLVNLAQILAKKIDALIKEYLKPLQGGLSKLEYVVLTDSALQGALWLNYFENEMGKPRTPEDLREDVELSFSVRMKSVKEDVARAERLKGPSNV